VKTLECMSAGVAVVTTQVGIEGIGGIPGTHYLLGESPEELADHVVRLLNSPTECASLGSSAQRLVSAEHQFSTSMENFCTFLSAMHENLSKCFRNKRTVVA
jgi:hypothetical protein